jgi:hypothetical protein
MMNDQKKTNPLVWVGLGCGLLVCLFIAFVMFLFSVIFVSMRSSDPYKDGLRIARNDERVRNAVGTPIEPGMFVSGSISTNNGSGNADINIPISGPKGGGSVHVVGTKEGGRWTYSALEFKPKNGPTIDLRAPLRTATPGG